MKFRLLLLATIVFNNMAKSSRRTDDENEFGRRRRSTDSSENINPPGESQLSKVLDFADDNDGKADKDGEFSSASLTGINLPESFAICTAFMVEAWTTDFSGADLFLILNSDGDVWGDIHLITSSSQTLYSVTLGSVSFLVKETSVFFPLQWTKVCLALDSITSKVVLVVDGDVKKQIGYETEHYRLTNMSIVVGLYPPYNQEQTGQTTNFNVFASDISVEKLKKMTTAGDVKCGAPGDFLSWNDAEWKIHSKAKIVDRVSEIGGPCKVKSKVQVFNADFENHNDCMLHCQKIAKGRSPSVITNVEWNNLTREVDLIAHDVSKLPWMWLSATEGDVNGGLGRLPHWPDEEEVENHSTTKLEAKEGIWRDFYSGKRLNNWTIPYSSELKDNQYGETYNCIRAKTNVPWNVSWGEQKCSNFKKSCPCQYSVQPLLSLRGLCKDSFLWNSIVFTPRQRADDPYDIVFVGHYSSRIVFNDTSQQWKLTDAKSFANGLAWATKVSYAIGKHEWTISNDSVLCNQGRPYNTKLKLTGCDVEEFTCDDGQCITMLGRCNQVPDCRDKSDEMGCRLIRFERSYNKNIPPIQRSPLGNPIPVAVNVSVNLMKVVHIDETDHSIHLQFQIGLRWRENRVKYHNLKSKTSLNALTLDDVNKLWLPLLVYTNTDQKESTRLGENWEWKTRVTVTRMGMFTRTGFDEVRYC